MSTLLLPETYITALCPTLYSATTTLANAAYILLPDRSWFYLSTIFPRPMYNFVKPGLICTDMAFGSAAVKISRAIESGNYPVLATIAGTASAISSTIQSPTLCEDLAIGSRKAVEDLSSLLSPSDDILTAPTWTDAQYWLLLAITLLKCTVYITLVLLTFRFLYFLTRKLYKYKFPEASLYVVDFSVFTDFSPSWRVTPETWFGHVEKELGISTEASNFARRIYEKSGIESPSHLPPTLLRTPPLLHMSAARLEAMVVMTGAMDALLSRTGLNPSDIDILITNCSLFNPTPSHTAMLARHYKLRNDLVTFSLAGMGCSASHIALDCARGALAAHPKKDAIAVVVSYENLTQNFYLGSKREMIVANALFRMGSAAIMLSKQEYVHGMKARYEVEALVRRNLSANADAYACVYQDSDESVGVTDSLAIRAEKARKREEREKRERKEGKAKKNGKDEDMSTDDDNIDDGARLYGTGVRLSKSVPRVAAKGLGLVMAALAPRFLSPILLLEYGVKAVGHIIAIKCGAVKIVDKKGDDTKNKLPTPPLLLRPLQSLLISLGLTVDPAVPPVPAFRKAFQHFCIHAGGRGVVEGISNVLSLDEGQRGASVRTLRKYGNTSSSSCWYALYESERQNPGSRSGACENWAAEDAAATRVGYQRGARYDNVVEYAQALKCNTGASIGMPQSPSVALSPVNSIFTLGPVPPIGSVSPLNSVAPLSNVSTANSLGNTASLPTGVTLQNVSSLPSVATHAHALCMTTNGEGERYDGMRSELAVTRAAGPASRSTYVPVSAYKGSRADVVVKESEEEEKDGKNGKKNTKPRKNVVSHIQRHHASRGNTPVNGDTALTDVACPAEDPDLADALYWDLCNWVNGEKRRGVQPGERVWMVFFGSGFKIGSVVLRKL